MALHFSVKTGLKNIIGGDLILDDFIAVFELVKNSFDAHATKVRLLFEKDKIIIWDNGKGMNLDDIKNKWLQVAYSAKKGGEEDEDLAAAEYKDYRDRMSASKYFAGAKGIGRFSSDRLGRRLLLTTKKVGRQSTAEQLSLNWGDFERDVRQRFEEIEVKHHRKPVIDDYAKFTHGTILEITNLRSSWPRKKLLELKHSLEKLINPFENLDRHRKTTVSRSRSFAIEIEARAEAAQDDTKSEARDKVNGPVGNFVFETLGLKTTQLYTEVSIDGKHITTQLEDRGKLIYRIREKNTVFQQLADVRMHVFYLNFAAKHNFKRKMGIDSVSFGSVFLYKNGFRIYPFGEEGVDSFGIDRRKQQGFARFLGSRDVIGRIELFGNDDQFQETSSRDGGLKKTPAYLELVDCFLKKCLFRLERYVVDVQWFLDDKKNEDITAIQGNQSARTRILQIINKLVDTDKVVLEEYAKDFLSLVDEKIEEGKEREVPEALEALEKLGASTSDKELVKQVKSARRAYDQMRTQKEEADQKAQKIEEARQVEEEARRAAEAELALEKQKSTYLLATRKTLSKDAEGLVHNIVINTKSIGTNIDTLIDKVRSNSAKPEEILRRLSLIKYSIDKTQKISKLITRANFRTQDEKQITDIPQYIEQYMSYYNDIYDINEKDKLTFEVKKKGASLTRKVNVLELSMVLDNLVSNSEKAGAKTVLIAMSNNKEGSLVIQFSDDGKGVADAFLKNPDRLFELGITTTDGSGIGLNHVREGLKRLGGHIRFMGNKTALKGAAFEMIID
jgi:signal transduction histidine kinase